MLRKVVLIMEEGMVRRCDYHKQWFLVKILLWDVSVIVYEHVQYVCM